MTPIFRATIESGRLNIIDRDDFDLHVRALAATGATEFELILRKVRKVKPGSREQQGYYWAVIVRMLADHFGYDPESMHLELKCRHARFMRDDGRWHVQDYSAMSTTEREEYHRRIREWAVTEFAFVIPLPNEVDI